MVTILRLCYAQFGFKFVFNWRYFAHGCFFCLAKRNYIIIKALNKYMAFIIFHTGKQLRKHKARVGRPVAVVATVQRAFRPVNG